MKPQRTITDLVVSSLSPVLIMLLVGSLVFFLIQVCYHGKAAGSLRWVLFWFVIGIVLVSRIGIEAGTQRAALFGFGLAAATSLYLMRTNPAFLLGIILLGIVWWCAHKLTWNCTYVDEEEDASGRGLMETLPDHLRRKTKTKTKTPLTAVEKTAQRHARLGSHFFKPVKSQPPGLWVLFFSAAALPLFGIGQMLLKPGDTVSRRLGFVFMVAYMVAVMGLLLTTSFLGLRRYLRQRYIIMFRPVALGWLRFGGGMTLTVLLIALLLPRPGSDYTWKTAALVVDSQLRRASQYAVRYNPVGKGTSRAGNQPGGPQDSGATDATPPQEQTGAGTAPPSDDQEPAPTQSPASAPSSAPPSDVQNLLRVLVVSALAFLFTWWLVRNRQLIIQAISAFIAAVRALLGLSKTPGTKVPSAKSVLAPVFAPPRPFANYKNPFATEAGRSWTPEQVIIYTYEAVQAWASELGIEFPPQQTAREFCADLAAKHPEIAWQLRQLTNYYAHAAYGTHLPADYDAAPVRQIWSHIAG
jgi:hypothetical protein